MTVTLLRRLSVGGLSIERLEDRVLLDVAPIGPISDPDNTQVWSRAYFSEINASLAAVDVPSQITIRTSNDANQRRDQLIDYLWKGAGFPTAQQPESVAVGVEVPFGPQYPSLPNLERVDRLTVAMDYGLRSQVYFFHPKESTDRLLIWHQGHDDDLAGTGGYDTVARFLEQGYAVLASWMPLLGENTLAEPLFIGGCEIFLGGHDDFACAETDNFAPLKYFVEPVAVALNYALAERIVTDVVMIGLSGGGWTTTLYAAVDPRVRVSIPVAGTLPTYLRQAPYDSDVGDWEQYGSSLYGVADYLDLYILGAYGPDRKQVQIFNKYDDCCFAGVRYRTYLDHVKDAVAGLGGGTFTAYLDDSLPPGGWEPSHRVSRHALATIVHHEVYADGVQFVDDGENTYWNGGGTERDTFYREGAWQQRKGPGFANDVLSARPGAGEAQARWQFQVAPGRYLVAVTWDPTAARGVGVAPYSVFDGQNPLGEFLVDQQWGPADFDDGLVFWHVLGAFTVTGTQLVVQLSNNTDGVVLADGARIASLGPPFTGQGTAAPLLDLAAIVATLRLNDGPRATTPTPHPWTLSSPPAPTRTALVITFPLTRHSA